MTDIKCALEAKRIHRLRPCAGQWFRDLRRVAEVTAEELAEQVGVDTALITAIERGEMHVPAALYPDFARVFGVGLSDFAKTCLMYEKPSAYEALFGSLPEPFSAAA